MRRPYAGDGHVYARTSVSVDARNLFLFQDNQDLLLPDRGYFFLGVILRPLKDIKIL